ncbi:MAG: DUF7144 family membrane protein [Actinomycetota bacterium]
MASTHETRSTSGWAIGFTYFAGFVMLMVGTFHAIAGFAGILENEFFVVTRNYAFEFDATAWGWIHLIAGVIVIVAAVGLFSGAVWARTVGVTMAVISAIANFGFIPYYPVWSIVIIALDVAVIWALTAHGRDIAASQ